VKSEVGSAQAAGMTARLAAPFTLQPSPWLLLAPSLVALVAFFVTPVLWLARLSLFEQSGSGGFYTPDSLTLRHYAAIVADPYFHNLAGVTVRLASLVTLAAMALAYPLAVYLYRAGPAIKTSVLLAVLLPKFTNLLVAMYGVLVLLANAGRLNRVLVSSGLLDEPLPMFANLFAVVVGETLIVTPYPVLILASALHGVDRQLEDAARGLGAGAWRAFYEVPFKLTLPSALLAALVTLIWALSAFTAPVVLGNPELYPVGVEVYTVTFEDANWPLGAALAIANLLAVLAIGGAALAVHRMLERR
jgi:putative spermidine/putrescine transport system permease protein